MATRLVSIVVFGLLLAGCGALSDGDSSGSPSTAPATQPTSATTTTTLATTSMDSTAPEADPTSTRPEPALPQRPDWLGTRDLTPADTTLGPIASGLATPPELRDRRFATIDRLPAPEPDAPFAATVEPVPADVLDDSTWRAGCPVEPDDLAYLTMTFWGFDDRPHTGDMIVNASVADDVVSVFDRLYEARYPIEELRVITNADLGAKPTGDGNVTASFVCRVTRGGRTFSEHASGLAIDVNPFINPYRNGAVVLPELAVHYLDRSLGASGQIQPGDVVVEAFAAIGWEWGGAWSSPVDYQHFALDDR